MSLEAILAHIHNKALEEKEKILRNARQEQGKIKAEATQEAQRLYQDIIERERSILARERQKQAVSARMEAKKALLNARQELLGLVFQELRPSIAKFGFKKTRIFLDRAEEIPVDIDFYLNQLRNEYEPEAARIIFGL